MKECYFCENCQRIIDESDLNVSGKDANTGEQVVSCPHCKSRQILYICICEECGTILNNKSDICDNCKRKIIDSVDYNIGYEYIIRNNELPFFVFEIIFDCPQPSTVNKLLMNELEMIFQRKKVEDLLYNKPFLLNKIREYINMDFEDFYEFLKEKGGDIDE